MPMEMDKPHITAKIAGRSAYPVLRAFAAGYFLATFACDLLYFTTQSSEQRRLAVAEFGLITVWLLSAGLAMAVLAGGSAVVDFRGERRFRDVPDLRLFVFGSLLVVVLEIYNLCLRYTDGSDAIMPMGFALSLSAVAVLLSTPSQNWDRMYG